MTTLPFLSFTDPLRNYLQSGTPLHQVYLACSGGGAGLQDILWSVGGISKVLLGAQFPYSCPGVDTFLGRKPDRYCSVETSIDLALRSLTLAKMEIRLRDDASTNHRHLFTTPCLGVGLTATLATDRAHRGDHRVHVAVIGDKVYPTILTLTLRKDVPGVPEGRSRADEGWEADKAGYYAIARTLGFGEQVWQVLGLGQTYLDHGDSLVILGDRPARDAIETRWFARPRWVHHPESGDFLPEEDLPPGVENRVFYPGSFNPPHAGHDRVAGVYPEAEWVIDAVNVDKGHVPVPDLLGRALAINARGPHTVLFTRNQGWFVDKFRAYPGCTWTLGTDTLDRVLNSPPGVRPGSPTAEEVIKVATETKTRIVVRDRPGFPTGRDLRDQHSLTDPAVWVWWDSTKSGPRGLTLGLGDESSTKIREGWLKP